MFSYLQPHRYFYGLVSLSWSLGMFSPRFFYPVHVYILVNTVLQIYSPWVVTVLFLLQFLSPLFHYALHQPLCVHRIDQVSFTCEHEIISCSFSFTLFPMYTCDPLCLQCIYCYLTLNDPSLLWSLCRYHWQREYVVLPRLIKGLLTCLLVNLFSLLTS